MRQTRLTMAAVWMGALALSGAAGLASGAHAEPRAAVDADADGAAEDAPTRTFRFELKALGQRAGEATLRIGAPTEVGGLTLRPIQIDAATAGIAKRFVNTTTASTSWVNERWLPVRARWDSMWQRVRRVVKAKFTGRKLHATDERDGELHREVDHRTRQPGADIISIFPWVMAQDMTPGTRYVIEVFDGFRVYDLALEVGGATQIATATGVRAAIPLHGTVSRGEHYTREVAFYLSADDARLPLKLVFKYGLLGEVEVVLVSHREA